MEGVPASLDLPRSVILALWLQAGAPDVARVVGDDEPHGVTGGRYDGLGALLAGLGGRGAVTAVLPAPGDPLVGPRDAAAAGECVLVHDDAGGTDLAIVPEIHRFGSALEPGATVVWHTREVEDWRTAFQAAVGSLDDAERGLREGLVLATQALVQLDVARWRPDAAERIVAIRDGALPTARLPRELAGSPQRVRVLQQAARLRAIVDLAAQDEGGAVNLWQSDQRSAALREVDRLARRAMSAASARLDGAEAPGDDAEPRRRQEQERRGGAGA